MQDLLDDAPPSQGALVKKTPAALVKERLGKITENMPKGILARFKTAAIAVAMQPGLSQCTAESVYSAVYAVARLNLIPDPILKQAYIIPFKGKATIVLGYPGLIELARRACPGLQMHTGVVYENDQWTKREGTHTEINIARRHWENGEEPGEVVLAFCAYKTPEATDYETVIVPRYELDKIAGAKGNVWKSDFVPMSEKTAIRRASKFWNLGNGSMEDVRRFREALSVDEAEDVPPGPEPENADLADIAEGESTVGQLTGADYDKAHEIAATGRRRVSSTEVKPG